MKIEIISGSARTASLTKRVAIHLQGYLASNYSVNAGLIDMAVHNLPPVQSVLSELAQAPDAIRHVARRMFEADAFILVSPEYNGGYAPALKNFLDHFPKQEQKVFGIVTASTGSMGGIRAALHLQNLVFGLFGIATPRMLLVPEVDRKFNADGALLDHPFISQIQLFAEEFIFVARSIHEGRSRHSRKIAA
jgi:NAD(P)H-dependent FMN reductase